MGSMEPRFLKGCIQKYYAQTYYEHYAHTGATHFSFTVAITHVCQLIPVSRIPRAQSLRARIMSEASSERIKANLLFMYCSLCSQGWRYYQYESAYFPAPYADNQLLCSLCDPKQSHAFEFCGLQTQLGLAVRRPTPETISGQKSKIYLGGHAPRSP